MDVFFNDFNEKQLNAIKADADKVCVYAGPGTGKTKTLVGRYVYLQKELGVLPKDILCLTFTKKAAQEMSEKIKTACGDNISKYIGTIHSMGNRILSEDIFRFGFPNKYSILTDDDQNLFIYDMMCQLQMFGDNAQEDNNRITINDVMVYINKAKNIDKECEYFKLILNKSLIEDRIQKINEEILQDNDSEEHLILLKEEKIYYSYLLLQADNYYLDFNDLILVTNYILRNSDLVLSKWASKFRHILVDEFQDLTDDEYELICHLASKYGRIFGVGDPDQSIYRFRGSRVEIFNEFYQSCDMRFDFSENYRSYQEIIDLSHDLISANTDRVVDIKLHCYKGTRLVPKIIHTVDRYTEAVYVAEKIQEINKKDDNLSDCAILYRNNQCSLVFEEYFQLKKIPYKVYSKNEFFKTEEIKTAIGYIKFMIYKDDLSFLTVIRKFNKYISNVMINQIKKQSLVNNITCWQYIKDNYKNSDYGNRFNDFVYFVKNMDLIDPTDDFEKWCIKILSDSNFLKYVFATGDEDKANNIKQLIDMIHAFEPDDPEKNIAEEFLNYIALLCDGDVNEEKDKVQMMSIHCSKGMQYKYVFVVDFNEGYMPSNKAEGKEDIAEERRVVYVAFTRAQNELYILESLGDDGSSKISSFSKSLNEYNYSFANYTAVEKKPSNTIIREGTLVKHKRNGKGIVESINSLQKLCTVKFYDYYNPKTVRLDDLIVITNQRELNFAINIDIVRKIKEEHTFEYTIGEIVIHKEYGSGIITGVND
ncbi:MAG: ATP-dependent helicase, partial [Clostridia bacterium]|nr:ATP-dependent helicase [Clostridia bacterium]